MFIVNSKPIEFIRCSPTITERGRVLVRWTGKGDLQAASSKGTPSRACFLNPFCSGLIGRQIVIVQCDWLTP